MVSNLKDLVVKESYIPGLGKITISATNQINIILNDTVSKLVEREAEKEVESVIPVKWTTVVPKTKQDLACCSKKIMDNLYKKIGLDTEGIDLKEA